MNTHPSLSQHRTPRWWWPLALLIALAVPSVAQAADLVVEKDVVYGEVGDYKLKLDVYRQAAPNTEANNEANAAAPTLHPAVIAVHGGAWRGGSKGEFAGICQGLANLGYVAFSVDYRLLTKTTNKWPVQINDVQRAVRWVRANAAKYGVDPNRIGALGASAGGHLVALLGTTDTRDNSDPALADYSSRVNCVVDIFGPTDFTVTPAEGGMSQLAVSLVLDFLGKTPEEAPDIYRDASPITHIDKKTVPFLIFHGTADPLVPLDQSQRFYEALQKAEIEATFIKFEGEGHGFQKPENIAKMIETTRAFLEKHLGDKPM